MPTSLRLFRIAAIAEAFSWAGLLIGMYVKYIAETSEIGVKIFGPIHGALFVFYVMAVFAAARQLGWRTPTIVLGLACAVPPFTSLWFERRELRRARTTTTATATSAAAERTPTA